MHNQLRGNAAGAVALVALAREAPRRTIARALARAGWRVKVAAHTAAALDLARADRLGLLVVGTELEASPAGTPASVALTKAADHGQRPRLVLVASEPDAATSELAKVAGAVRVVIVPDNPTAPLAPHLGTATERSGPAADERELWIVDDTQAIRLLVRHAFEREGWRVREFANLGSALEASELCGAAGSERPSAIVLDIHLPDGNGLDSVSRFAATGAAVLMVSNLAGPEQVERAFAAGAADLVSKPFDLRSLVARVGRAIALTPASVVTRDVVPADLPPHAEHEAAVVLTHWG